MTEKYYYLLIVICEIHMVKKSNVGLQIKLK